MSYPILNKRSSIVDNSIGGIVGHDRVNLGPIVKSVNALIPWDDTIPQITEGAEVLAVTYTPKYKNSKLIISTNVTARPATSAKVIIGALFRDGAADALASGVCFDSSYAAEGLPISAEVVVNNLDPITFSLRMGTHQTSLLYVGGNTSGTRLLGGSLTNYLEVTEINLDVLNNIPSANTNLELSSSRFHIDAVDIGVTDNQIFNILSSLDFSPSADGAVWASFNTVGNWNLNTDVSLDLYYLLNGTDDNKDVKMEVSIWGVSPGDTELASTPDTTYVDTINSSTTQGIYAKTELTAKVINSLITADTTIVIKIKRLAATDAGDNYTGSLKLAKVVAHQ